MDERTNGRIKMQVYGGAQLGQEKKTVELTQTGIIAFNRVNTAPLLNFSLTMSVLHAVSVPDEDHLWQVLDGSIGKGLLKGMESSNLVGLEYYNSGARSFCTKGKPIKSLADMKGLKIRVQSARVFIDMVNALETSSA